MEYNEFIEKLNKKYGVDYRIKKIRKKITKKEKQRDNVDRNRKILRISLAAIAVTGFLTLKLPTRTGEHKIYTYENSNLKAVEEYVNEPSFSNVIMYSDATKTSDDGQYVREYSVYKTPDDQKKLTGEELNLILENGNNALILEELHKISEVYEIVRENDSNPIVVEKIYNYSLANAADDLIPISKTPYGIMYAVLALLGAFTYPAVAYDNTKEMLGYDIEKLKQEIKKLNKRKGLVDYEDFEDDFLKMVLKHDLSEYQKYVDMCKIKTDDNYHKMYNKFASVIGEKELNRKLFKK